MQLEVCMSSEDGHTSKSIASPFAGHHIFVLHADAVYWNLLSALDISEMLGWVYT